MYSQNDFESMVIEEFSETSSYTDFSQELSNMSSSQLNILLLACFSEVEKRYSLRDAEKNEDYLLTLLELC